METRLSPAFGTSILSPALKGSLNVTNCETRRCRDLDLGGIAGAGCKMDVGASGADSGSTASVRGVYTVASLAVNTLVVSVGSGANGLSLENIGGGARTRGEVVSPSVGALAVAIASRGGSQVSKTTGGGQGHLRPQRAFGEPCLPGGGRGVVRLRSRRVGGMPSWDSWLCASNLFPREQLRFSYAR